MAVRSLVRHVVVLAALAGLGMPAAPSAAVAQATGTATGKVTDLVTGEPLVSARISVVGNLTATITRSDGTYRLALPAGTQDIRVSAIGYATGRASVTITAGGTTTQNFTLERAAIALEEISVTGSRRSERSAIDQPVPVDVLTQEEIHQTGRTETAQILQSLAPSLNFPAPRSATAPTTPGRPPCAGWAPTRSWCSSTANAATPAR